MEGIIFTDLHLSDPKGKGGLSKYVSDSDKVILDEASKATEYARKNGINHVFILGDVGDSYQLSERATLALISFFVDHADLEFYIIPGNHDQFGSPRDGHGNDVNRHHDDNARTSLDFLCEMQQITKTFKDSALKNVHIYRQPTKLDVSKVPFQLLPYPYTDFSKSHINLFHNEVYGSKGDNGRVNKSKHSTKAKSSHLGASGHLHTAQQVGNIHYPGSLYQTNFGEGRKKYWAHFEATFKSNELRFELELQKNKPKYTLHTCVINSRKDLKQLPTGKYNLIKLVVADGVAVTTADYPSESNIVEVKPFKGLQELAQALTSDLEVGEELVVDVDAFFDSWIESADVEDELRAEVREVRRALLQRVVNK